MDRYEQLSVVGEGSYGLVMKCRHKDSEQIVAIKKFLGTEEDAIVRKMALREIRMLKRLKHENLVTMVEVFRCRKRFYLVFEYVERTVLDELEKAAPGGLGDDLSRDRIFQVTRAVYYCHSNNVIHRDIKPENVLVSSQGVVKLCDFGFARLVSIAGEQCTEYVATRWYRAPELLVGEQNYGAPVDLWAVGCLYAEMVTGDPLFPGESDIDQLYLTLRLLGKPCYKHQQLMSKNSQLRGMIRTAATDPNGLKRAFPSWPTESLSFLTSCLQMDPLQRPTAAELLQHEYFTHDDFSDWFVQDLRQRATKEFDANPLLRRLKRQILNEDNHDEVRPRRSLDTPKWRINVVEGVKRKYSCDHIVCDKNGVKASERTTFVRTKSGHRSNQQPMQKMGQISKHGLCYQQPGRDKILHGATNLFGNVAPSHTSEMQMLQKTLESLSKMKSSSAEKEKTDDDSNASSPYRFQSLQTNFTDDVNKSSPITHNGQHICWNKDQQVKKSPNTSLLFALQASSTRSTLNQIPSLNQPRGQQFIKRSDKSVAAVEAVEVSANAKDGPKCSDSGELRKSEKQRGVADFTLPNVPGATATNLYNRNNKKKLELSPDGLKIQTITPDAMRRKKPKKRTYENVNTGCYEYNSHYK